MASVAFFAASILTRICIHHYIGESGESQQSKRILPLPTVSCKARASDFARGPLQANHSQEVAMHSASVNSRWTEDLQPKMREENNRRGQRGCWCLNIHQALEASTAFPCFCLDKSLFPVTQVRVLHCAGHNFSSFPPPYDGHVQMQGSSQILDLWSSVQGRLWLYHGVLSQ